MYKQYIKQALKILLQTPYLSFISILGTALAITLIMMLIIGKRAVQMNLSPENHRDRTLYIKWIGVEDKVTGHTYANGYMSLKTIRECFQSLETPEAVCITSPLQAWLAGVPGGTGRRSFILFTDDIFWKIFDFKILAGKVYDKSDVEGGIKKVVLSERLARFLFHSVPEAINKTVQLNYVSYTVSAVVDNVTSRTPGSYAEAWIPYTSAHIPEISGGEGTMGKYKCQILAYSSSDFGKIRDEVAKQVKRYNSSLSDYRITLYRQPDTKYVDEMRFGPGYPDMREKYVSFFLTILVILLVPAINLSGLTFSRMNERITELGVRKAFGGTRSMLLIQVLSENMVISFIGGVLGLIFSFVALTFLHTWLMTTNNYWGLDVTPELPASAFINFETFGIAFVFCTLLNLLSAGIPAWRVSSVPIVKSLKGE